MNASMSDGAALATACEDEVDHDLTAGYLETLALVERLHRLLLDVIKDEFERLGRSMSTPSRRCCCSISAIR